MKIPEAVKAFLQKPYYAVLATMSPSGQPQATPVWYLLENDHLLLNTSRGRIKLRNIEANPRVAVTILDPENPYRYIQIQGKVVKLDPKRGPRDIDRLAQRYHGRPHQYRPNDAAERRVSIIIRPTRFNASGIK